MSLLVFLLINSLFMWVFPGEWNIFDSGYAGLDTLFFLSPWVFLFLVPAVTMRMIAEEKRLGTIELIYSRPITERGIIWGKYLASILLVLLALFPGLIYYISVYMLGSHLAILTEGGHWVPLQVSFFLHQFMLLSVFLPLHSLITRLLHLLWQFLSVSSFLWVLIRLPTCPD